MLTSPSRTAILRNLIQSNPLLWRAEDFAKEHRQNRGISTGFCDLDRVLPEHGWPNKTLMEFITPHWGIGELQLLLPLMKSITDQGQWLLWVSPPFTPYAPALANAGIDINRIVVVNADNSCKDALWTIEKALQNHACGMVLAWLNWLPNGVIRRLQLAAQTGNSLGVLFRQHETKNSPAPLRIKLVPGFDALTIKVLKARGTSRQQSVRLFLS